MNISEINTGIELICKTSKDIREYYEDPEKLIGALNRVPIEEIDKCLEYYSGRSGVVVDLRKEVIEYLSKGKKLNVKILENFINKHRDGKEKQFRAYKQWFTLFFPPITFYGHNDIRKFVEGFVEKIIIDLELKNKVKSIFFDFQGARQQGSDRLWIAIYNRDQESHSSGIQFFIQFFDGKIEYGVYRHSDKSYLKDKVALKKSEFNYDHLLEYFKSATDQLLDNTPKKVSGNSIDKVKSDISKNLTENLNVILFGPPGTGKTYQTINYALSIIENTPIEKINEGEASIGRDSLSKRFKAYKEGGQIEFITFHQNYAYEDFIQGLRPSLKHTDGSLSFELVDGVFKRLADTALENFKASKVKDLEAGGKPPFKKVFDSYFEKLVEGEVDSIQIKMKKASYNITGIGEKSISFKKQTGTTNHTFSISTLADMYEREEYTLTANGGLQSYYMPLLNALLAHGKTMEIESTFEDLKQFVIIIDEINRANISRVFGELITLIEEDKRYGRINEMKATLPSGEPFIVPSNLHIIGTMNTADKSIALIDIALRRRFEFIKSYPEIELVAEPYQELVNKINNQIVELKGPDFQIGHAYFMEKPDQDFEIKNTMNKKIIPLLYEYFMNDGNTVQSILDGAGVKTINKYGLWEFESYSNE
jgi:5-methylcytosine-specific restriction endonuclease McrBC GTP-binding regulatory subunit McrB